MNFLQDLKQKLEKSVETAGQKSQQMLEMSRLAIRIKGKKEDIERAVSRLGWEVLRVWNKGGELSATGEIRKLLEEVKDQQAQLSKLERELEEVRSSLVTLKETVEKVDVGTGKEEESGTSDRPVESSGPSPARNPEAGHEAIPVAQAAVKPKPPAAVVSAIVYICPWCAKQVPADSSECPHCRRRFF